MRSKENLPKLIIRPHQTNLIYGNELKNTRIFF